MKTKGTNAVRTYLPLTELAVGGRRIRIELPEDCRVRVTTVGNTTLVVGSPISPVTFTRAGDSCCWYAEKGTFIAEVTLGSAFISIGVG